MISRHNRAHEYPKRCHSRRKWTLSCGMFSYLMERKLEISFALIVAVCSLCTFAPADTFSVDHAKSVIAIVVHKAGFLSGFAHNHLGHPTSFSTEAVYDRAQPQQSRFSVRFPVTSLSIDGETAQRLSPELIACGILEAPLPRVSEKERRLVYTAILSEDQLDAEHYPEVTAVVKDARPREIARGQKTFAYEVMVAVTMRGKTVERPFAANIRENGDHFQGEAVGALKFSDFGIKPYTAFLGTIKNEDVFHVYVRFEGKRTG